MSTAMNMSLEITLSGASNARLMHVMGTRKPLGANWQLLQDVTTRKIVIRAKWSNLIDETFSATTSNIGAVTLKQLVSVFNVATHSAPTLDHSKQKGPLFPALQLQPNGEIRPNTVKLNPTNQYGQNESYHKAEKILTMQDSGRWMSNGEKLIIKVPASSLDGVALAKLLLIFFSFLFSFQILMKENPPENVIVAMIIVFVFVLFQQMNRIDPRVPNLLRDRMQIATNKQFRLLCCTVSLMSALSGAYAGDSSENIGQSSNPVDGNAPGEDDYITVAAVSLALMIIGGAAAWWMWKRPPTPGFDVDEGLRQSPTPRRSTYEIFPLVRG